MGLSVLESVPDPLRPLIADSGVVGREQYSLSEWHVTMDGHRDQRRRS